MQLYFARSLSKPRVTGILRHLANLIKLSHSSSTPWWRALCDRLVLNGNHGYPAISLQLGFDNTLICARIYFEFITHPASNFTAFFTTNNSYSVPQSSKSIGSFRRCLFHYVIFFGYDLQHAWYISINFLSDDTIAHHRIMQGQHLKLVD